MEHSAAATLLVADIASAAELVGELGGAVIKLHDDVEHRQRSRDRDQAWQQRAGSPARTLKEAGDWCTELRSELVKHGELLALRFDVQPHPVATLEAPTLVPKLSSIDFGRQLQIGSRLSRAARSSSRLGLSAKLLQSQLKALAKHAGGMHSALYDLAEAERLHLHHDVGTNVRQLQELVVEAPAVQPPEHVELVRERIGALQRIVTALKTDAAQRVASSANQVSPEHYGQLRGAVNSLANISRALSLETDVLSAAHGFLPAQQESASGHGSWGYVTAIEAATKLYRAAAGVDPGLDRLAATLPRIVDRLGVAAGASGVIGPNRDSDHPAPLRLAPAESLPQVAIVQEIFRDSLASRHQKAASIGQRS